MTNFSVIQKQRADALFARWVRESAVLVSAENLARVGRLEAMLDPDGAEIIRVGQRKTVEQAAIVKWDGVSGPEAYSLWCTGPYTGYRGAYAAFIRQVYGSQPGPEFAQFEVDHLFNRARTFAPSDYVRLEAISAAVNHRWGVTYEVSGSNPDSFRARPVGSRSMDFMVAIKLIGVLPPDSSRDVAGIRRIAQALRARGLLPGGFPPRQDPATGRAIPASLEYELWHYFAYSDRKRSDTAPFPGPPPGI